MFGKNQVSGSFNEAGDVLLVNEIFYTIQGEGPDSGRTAVFVRLSKCNLRCYFCDTEFEKGTEMATPTVIEEVLNLAGENGCRLVVITGGEPLLQNIVLLVQALNKLGFQCSVETAGTVYYPELTNVFHPLRHKGGNLMVCSPKTPKIHPKIEELVGAWKYVVRNGEGDQWGMPTKSTQVPGRDSVVFFPKQPSVEIWVQPMDVQEAVGNHDNLMWARDVCLKHGHRLGTQVHKLAELR